MRRQPGVTRRTLLCNTALGTAALAAGGIGAYAQPASKPPNIIFILADDLGYADVSCYGRRDFTTPNIDRIAARGMRFLQGYANSAVCSATRLALITGRYQYRLPLGLEEPLAGNPEVGLPPEHPTLPSLLKKAGYGTSLIGKWHLGALPKFGPLKSGYDHFFGFRGGAVDYFSHINPRQRHDLWDQDVEVHQVGYLTDQLGARAVDAVNSYAKSGQPFLISLHFNAPHWPWEGPGDEAESKRLRRHQPARLRRRHAEDLSAHDRGDGRADRPRAGGSRRQRPDREYDRHLHQRQRRRAFRRHLAVHRQETDLLEGGLRIPMVIAWPARIAPGRTSDQVAITMDWLPTLLAAAGTAPDPGYPPDGMNLLPALTGNAAAVDRKLFWRYKGNWQRAARIGDYKFLKILDNTFLFNVVEDPLERANLKERHKDVYDRLVAEWQAWNASMLPEVAESFTNSFTGEELADHYGAQKASGAPDPIEPLPPAAQLR